MARSFNGTSDLIDFGNMSLGGDLDGSMAIWVNFTGTPRAAYQSIFSCGNQRGGGGSDNFNFEILSSVDGTLPNRVTVDTGVTGSNLVVLGTHGTDINAGYYHLGMTYDNTIDTITGYLNGISKGTNNVTPRVNVSPVTTKMGAGTNSGGSTAEFALLNGAADAAIWSVKLTAGEMALLASGVRPYRVRRDKLIFYAPIEGTASPEPDVIGGFNGTLTGTSQVANPFNYTTPKYGSRLFAGGTDIITRTVAGGSTLDITGQNLTAACWFKLTSAAADQGLVSRWDNNNGSNLLSFLFQLSGAGHNQLFSALGNGGSGADVGSTITGATTLSTGVWYHGVFRASSVGPTTTLYLNGVSDASHSFSTSIGSNAGAITIGGLANTGGSPTSNNMNGSIADAAMWNVALSTDEIAKLAAGFRPYQVRPSGLLAYWPLEGTASPEPDMIAGNNGTLTGTSAGASPTRYQDVVGA